MNLIIITNLIILGGVFMDTNKCKMLDNNYYFVDLKYEKINKMTALIYFIQNYKGKGFINK